MFEFIIYACILWLSITVASVLVKQDWGKCAPFVCASIVLFVYSTSIFFHTVRLGVYAWICLAMIFLIIILVRQKNGLLTHIKQKCWNSSIVYCIFIIIICFMMFIHGSQPNFIDEFWYSELMCQDIFNNDYFYITEGCKTYFHNDYPPIIYLMNSLPSLICNNYSFESLYGSLWLFQILIYFPLISEHKQKPYTNIAFAWKNWGYCILISAIFLLSSFFVSFAFEDSRSSFWLNLYNDTVLGLVAGLGLIISFRKNNTLIHWIAEAILLSFLVLIKQIGVLFCVLIIISCLINLIIKKTKLTKILWQFALLVIPCSLFFISWKFTYINSGLNINQIAQFNIDINTIIATIQSIFNQDQNVYKYCIFDQIVNEKLLGVSNFALFKIPILILSIICILIQILLLIIYKWKKIEKLHLIQTCALSISVLIIYTSTIFISYFIFQYYSQPITASFNRYIGTGLCIVILINQYLILWLLLNTSKIFKNLLLLLVGYGVCVLLSFSTFCNGITIQNNDVRNVIGLIFPESKETYLKYDNEKKCMENNAQIIEDSVVPYSKIYYLNSINNNNFYHWIHINYYLNTCSLIIMNNYKLPENDNCEYLLTSNDENLINLFCAYYDVNNLQKNSLYKIHYNNNKLQLQYLNSLMF